MIDLGPAPEGFSWKIKSSKGNRGSVKGTYYQIILTQSKAVIIDQRFFVPKSEESTTDSVIENGKKSIRKIICP